MEQRLVLLTSVSDPNLARLLGARLEAEGIEAHLRGEALGPYRLNVGAMAVTEIWIPSHQMDEATLLLLAIEADSAVTETEPVGPGPSANPVRSWFWWLVAAILVVVWLVSRVIGY